VTRIAAIWLTLILGSTLLLRASTLGRLSRPENKNGDRLAELSSKDYLDRFLKSWLLESGSVNQFLDEHFAPPVGDELALNWPESMRPLSPRKRALDFALSCAGPRVACLDLESCMRRAIVTEHGLYDIQQLRVDDKMVKEFPALRDLVRRDVLSAVFVLRRCNIGCYVIFEAGKGNPRRIRSITYLAR
jgi:hypothetical protein